MDLHSIAFGYVASVNPPTLVSIQVSTGYTTGADGTQVPAYAAPYSHYAQLQALTYDDLKQVDGLSIEGTRRACYIKGDYSGAVRSEGKGPDLFTTPDGQQWMVAYVLERWPDPLMKYGWTKLVLVLQSGPPGPPSVSGMTAPIQTSGFTASVSYGSWPFDSTAASFTVELPLDPSYGDAYYVFDASGACAVHPVTISGNGNNIDGGASVVFGIAYQGNGFKWVGTQWVSY